jgi:hypothetical protein
VKTLVEWNAYFVQHNQFWTDQFVVLDLNFLVKLGKHPQNELLFNLNLFFLKIQLGFYE